MTNVREAFNETISQMAISSSNYHQEYVFYAHMIAQCRVTIDEELKAPCAVNFKNDHYNLFLNPELFNELTLPQRMAKLKEEMLHILYNHVTRIEGRDAKKFDYAADCAVNQHINKDHLTEDVTTPDAFPSKSGTVPPNMTAEQYYEMVDLPENDDDNNSNGDGSGSGEGESEARSSHSKWEESEGHEVVQKDITKNMAQKAQHEAQKSRGDTPSQYAEWMELLSTEKEVDWRQVLRRIVGNKRANLKRTLRRPDRRMPHLAHIKGRTKDRIFDLLTIGDESGSVSSKELMESISETVQLCKTMGVTTRYIAVDTEAHPSIELKATTKTFERKASGGTYISGAIDQAKEENLQYDAVLIITDGYLCESDVEKLQSTNKRTIFLITSDGQIMNSMNSGKSMAIQLKGNM